MKKIWFSLSVFIVLAGLVCCIWWPSNKLRVVVCDVGQGDAILITYGFWQMLVDGGKDTALFNCLDQSMPFWDRNIELIVLTHAHLDHFGGMVEVFDRYSVSTMIIQTEDEKTADFTAFKELLSSKKVARMKFLAIRSPQVLRVDDLELHVVWPALITPPIEPSSPAESLLWDMSNIYATNESNTNNSSITIWLRYKSFSALLTGDLEKEGELALVSYGLIRESNLLKVGHHGSKTSTSNSFLDSVKPEQSVISLGPDNTYGHPDEEISKALINSGTTLYRTDMQGMIVITTDGQSYSVATERKASVPLSVSEP